MGKKIFRFPQYLIQSMENEPLSAQLHSSDALQEFRRLYRADQLFDFVSTMQFVETHYLTRDINRLTADDFLTMIQEIHRCAAYSISLLEGSDQSYADYVTRRMCITRETGDPNISWDLSEAVGLFSQRNYIALEKLKGKDAAEAYRAFCEALKTRAESFLASGPWGSFDDYFRQMDLLQFIQSQGLDQHPGYAVFRQMYDFGSSPKDISEQMKTLANTLVDRIQQLKDPFEYAAHAAITLCRIHPFSNGNGRTARILVNYILMNHGIPPIAFDQDKKAYQMAVTHGLEDERAFADYLRKNVEKNKEDYLKNLSDNFEGALLV